MATVIKKISELDHLEELTSSSNVIIEENGEAKRFSAASLGKVKTVNGVEPDENGNIEVEIAEINYPVTSVNGMTGDVVIEIADSGSGGGSGFSGSWNDLTDKPFGATVLYEWNEETEYSEVIPVPAEMGSTYSQFAKISSDAPAPDFLLGNAVVLTDSSGETFKESLTEDSFFEMADGMYNIATLFMVCTVDSLDIMGLTFTKGIWCQDNWGASEGDIVPTSAKLMDVKHLDETYIPDTIARVDQIPNVPDTSSFATKTYVDNAVKNSTSGPETIKEGIGTNSEQFNYGRNIAYGDYSHAEGYETVAVGNNSHAEGSSGYDRTVRIVGTAGATEYSFDSNTLSKDVFPVGAIVNYLTAYAKIVNVTEGAITLDKTISADSDFAASVRVYDLGAFGENSHVEGRATAALGKSSHAEGDRTTAAGYAAHAEGSSTTAAGSAAHAEGYETRANGHHSHVQGRWNIEDTENKFAHIVGNGSSDARSNAHTVDWDGNAWYAGTVEATCIILKSSTEGSSKRFLVTVDDSGNLTASEITE